MIKEGAEKLASMPAGGGRREARLDARRWRRRRWRRARRRRRGRRRGRAGAGAGRGGGGGGHGLRPLRLSVEGTAALGPRITPRAARVRPRALARVSTPRLRTFGASRARLALAHAPRARTHLPAAASSELPWRLHTPERLAPASGLLGRIGHKRRRSHGARGARQRRQRSGAWVRACHGRRGVTRLARPTEPDVASLPRLSSCLGGAAAATTMHDAPRS